MRNYKLTLAYDGTAYHGWQRQPGRPTVQGTLESALERVLGTPILVTGSSRTDSGVHAFGQVVSFRCETRMPPAALAGSLNSALPGDVAVRELEFAPEDFHAIGSTERKRYRYVFDDSRRKDPFRNRWSWPVRFRLDEAAMREAADLFVGTHDFVCFESKGAERQSTVRTMFAAEVRRQPPPDETLIRFEIEGSGFLYNMVRAMAGTLLEVGRGKRPVAWVAEVLAGRDRHRAGKTAPPEGLTLLFIRCKGDA